MIAPALLYHGSKFRLASWVRQFFPPHRLYVEPYAGSMAVLLTKDPAQTEVANDLDQEVVNFFRILRTRSDELINQIMLTPYSRAEFDASYAPADDDLERARRLYVRSWMGYGVKLGRWKTGFQTAISPTAPNISRRWTRVDHLWILAERLRSTIIECEPALRVIRRYDAPDALFYVDPPYVASTRSKWFAAGYNHEMTEQDHIELAGLLHRIKGMAIIAGYPSALYNQLYDGWRMVSTSARNVKSQIVTECMWLSPAVTRAFDVPAMFQYEVCHE